MQIIKIIIEKKMGLHDEFMLKRNYLRAFSHFYSCFNLAMAILGKKLEKDKEKKIRKLWSKLLVNEFNEKNLTKMKAYIEEDLKEIIKARKMMDQEIDSSDYYKSKLDERGAIMVIGYDYPLN